MPGFDDERTLASAEGSRQYQHGSSAPPQIISYVTDVEGNLSYFERWVALSPALSFSTSSGSSSRSLVLAAGYGVVFGGDLFDKGPGDMRVAKLLCDLKERHPSRVWLLLGNRDINKMRLTSELCTPGELGRIHDGDVQIPSQFPLSKQRWVLR